MTPAELAAIALDLDSYSVEAIKSINLFSHSPVNPYIHVPLVDWLRVVDQAYDLDSGELPKGSASLLHDIVMVFLHREGHVLSASVRMNELADVEDVLHLMRIKELEAWKALAAVAA